MCFHVADEMKILFTLFSWLADLKFCSNWAAPNLASRRDNSPRNFLGIGLSLVVDFLLTKVLVDWILHSARKVFRPSFCWNSRALPSARFRFGSWSLRILILTLLNSYPSRFASAGLLFVWRVRPRRTFHFWRKWFGAHLIDCYVMNYIMAT